MRSVASVCPLVSNFDGISCHYAYFCCLSCIRHEHTVYINNISAVHVTVLLCVGLFSRDHEEKLPIKQITNSTMYLAKFKQRLRHLSRV